MYPHFDLPGGEDDDMDPEDDDEFEKMICIDRLGILLG